jgi:radical SAM superfamily enzyme YgiQ (UPF0313 family)
MSKSLYVVNPRNDFPSFYTLDALAEDGLRLQHYGDLAITTVAMFAPDDFSVTLCDESVTPANLDTPCDFVALTGKAGQIYRMLTLGRKFRKRGKVVIMGGPFASLSPSFLKPYCDVLVIGELENVAAELFSDLGRSQWKSEYVGDRPGLDHRTVPRWDLYPNDRTIMATVQTSRGCPFQCEFCDVIVYLGRQQRHKPVPVICRELDAVYRAGYRTVFFADDNLTVYRQHAKELAVAVREWNSRQPAGLVKFGTQISIDSARDEELLRLWSRAGLTHCFVGIETPNEESLRETKKRQNMHVDLVEQVEILLSHGIGVLAGMIIGFDADGPDIFERQFDFAMASPIPVFALNTLVAPPGTPLFERLQKENRLRLDSGTGFMLGRTNFVPGRLSSEELEIGFRWLANKLYAPKAFEQRLSRFLDRMEPAPDGVDSSISDLQARVNSSVLAGVSRMGSYESAMVERVWRRIEGKPRVAHVTMEWLRHYQQVRFMYERGGIWDARVGETAQPFQTSGMKTTPDTRRVEAVP